MPDRLGIREALHHFTSHPLSFLLDATVREHSSDTPRTYYVMAFVLLIFGFEVGLMFRAGAQSTEPIVAYYFIHVGWVAWPLAPFIHKGVFHVAGNVLMLYVAAPVERELSGSRYLGLLFLAGYLPVYADGLKLAVFGNEPNVLSAGASAFAFGLLGFGLVKSWGRDWQLSPRWWLIALGGVSGVIVVLENLIMTIASGNPVTLHLGHVGGVLVGLVYGLFDEHMTAA